MLNLTVRNVGQGDCIILKWKNDQGDEELGIIDCNDHEMSSLLNEISEVKAIKFILLTHPHSDHFSGLLKLLKYCFKPGSQIKVEKVFHTAAFSPSFLMGAINFPQDRESFAQLLQYLHDVHKSNEIETTCGPMIAGVKIDLNPDMEITCLAPELYDEIEKFKSATYDQPDGIGLDVKKSYAGKANNPHGNYLSTVLLISGPGWEILLTSDAVNTTFERLMSVRPPFANGTKKIIIGQIPHHGSIANHSPSFWKHHINKAHSYTFVSSGENRVYRHPHLKVVKFFDEASNLKYTNYVHGLREYYDTGSQARSTLSEVLDFITEKVPSLPASDRRSSHIDFEINSEGEIKC